MLQAPYRGRGPSLNSNEPPVPVLQTGARYRNRGTNCRARVPVYGTKWPHRQLSALFSADLPAWFELELTKNVGSEDRLNRQLFDDDHGFPDMFLTWVLQF